MYRDKRVWAEIGSRLVSSLSYYNDFKISEEEIFELIANGEYLLDDSEEIYGKNLINLLKIWEIIRTKIIETKDNFIKTAHHKWAFNWSDYREIYLLLDEKNENGNIFENEKFINEKSEEMTKFFENCLIEESSLESILEDILISYIYLAIHNSLGIITSIFMYLIINAMLLYKEFGPILATYRGEVTNIWDLVKRLTIQCRNLPIKSYITTPLFSVCLRRIIDLSENNKLFFESI
ncbi:hypothetical protein [Spiroplasma cantharicola]|uniref:Uncharacterized protein n=1 Tax=Spiroplasma cantharicola TaxID=362837 RepID=A0A0M5KCN5_9MOLU|nr:hypothetical protein [Spiroplasma cantharicola]ALD66719.1 hypothetical protein SCANT_v1c08130 [Spiroplasma cantharicola]